MPRPHRRTPQAQLSLFPATEIDAKLQNNRWIAAGTTTIRNLLEATRREPEENYGVQTDVQRPLHKSHCMKIAEYLRTTDQWIMAPFVFTSEGEGLELANGEFSGFTEDFNVLDGQHRIQALHITADNLRYSETQEDRERLHRMESAHIVLQYVQNKGPVDASQLFVDLNRGKAVTSAELAYLDGRDAVVNVIREAIAAIPAVQEHTDRTRASPDRRSNDVWTIATLKTILKAIEVGVKPSLPAARRNHMATEDGKAESVESLEEFLRWLLNCRKEYRQLADQPGPSVPDENTRHYAYDTKWMALLAETWANAGRNSEDTGALAQYIETVNINRNDAASALTGDRYNLLDERDRMKPLGRGPYAAVSAQIRQQAARNGGTPHRTDR